MSSLLRPSSWVYHQLANKHLALRGQCKLLPHSHVTCLASLIGHAAVIPIGMPLGGHVCISKRFVATKKQTPRKDTKQVARSAPGTGQGDVAIGQRVVQAGKDVSYMGVVIVGIGVTAIMFYAVGRELFASNSPNAIYTKAYKVCKRDSEIIEELGEPITGFGETTRRGRRRHVSHLEYEQNGVKHMRMKFYIQGPKRKGTVQLEVKEGETGKYEYRYLFVELDGYPHRTVILEDNR